MTKIISNIKFDDTLNLTQCHDGFWLYDTTRGMNLSMKAKTSNDALFQALKYYQKRLIEVEKSHLTLKNKVDSFICQFDEDEDEEVIS